MKRRLCLQGAWALASGSMLAGCASTPTPNLRADQWAGRLVLHIHDTPAQRHSATFELLGNAQNGELTLLNPLGTTVAQARWAPGLAQLEQGSQTQSYSDMPSLLQAATGAALPLEAVFDWLQGVATHTPGWDVDLTQHAQGRIRASRSMPQPSVQLLIVLQ